MTVRVRFAPSPTGYLHIGGARTALFNWLIAKRYGGQFILRIEDTDQKRLVSDSNEDIMRSLRWLGLEWDEGPDIGGPYGPYIQSQRIDMYQKWANWLLENDHAYKCFATAEELAAMREEQMREGKPLGYDRRYRWKSADEIAAVEATGLPYVIRFKAPLDGETTFNDAIRGPITYANTQITDQVLLKSDGFPTYHLANVVDDHFMRITHIMRADEWINTAPLHVNLYKAFGWEMPIIAHVPVVLSPSGKGKLSKRDQAFQDGNRKVLIQVGEFADAGYPPEAVINFLSNVGWSFGDDIEKFTVEEAIPRFALSDISPAPTRLPYAKLEWLSGQYIQDLDPIELAQRVKPHLEKLGYEVNLDALLAVMPAMSVRLKKYTDAAPFLHFLLEPDAWTVPTHKLTHKKMGREAALQAYAEAHALISSMETLDLDAVSDGLRAIGAAATDNGKAGPFLGTLRFALTGQKISPPLFESILALGRDQTLQRLSALQAALTA